MDKNYYRVRADIDLDALRTNIINIKKGLKDGTKVCAVIKADAYGHGAVKSAHAINDIVDFYAVAAIEEALELKKNKIKKPVLILGLIDKSAYKDAILKGIRMTVSDYKSAVDISKAAKEAGKKAVVHIKLNTGMNRIGFRPDENSLQEILKINSLEGIEIEGIFTHLFNADDKTIISAEKQIAVFEEFCRKLDDEGVRIKIRHCSNSAAATRISHANFDMVRLGISMYGLYPSQYVDEIKLKPVMSLVSKIAFLKEIEKGETIGYGATFKAKGSMKIATVPVGYADGYMRNLSNKGFVLIHGMKCNIVGRVCMDQLMVDVSDCKYAKLNEPVVLIGKSGRETITMEEISNLAGSFNYEFACNINKRVPRFYYQDKELICVRDYFGWH